jgi:hypothetical protein
VLAETVLAETMVAETRAQPASQPGPEAGQEASPQAEAEAAPATEPERAREPEPETVGSDDAAVDAMNAATVLAALSGQPGVPPTGAISPTDAIPPTGAASATQPAPTASADPAPPSQASQAPQQLTPQEQIKTEPPEASPWSAPPASPAEQETALVRPVRLESDQLPRRRLSEPTPSPAPASADLPTRIVAPPTADQPTRVVPDAVPTQRVAPVPPAAPTWPQPSEPAQLWGTPREPYAQQPSFAPAQDAGHGDDEWEGWDDDLSRRRPTPPPAVGGRERSGFGSDGPDRPDDAGYGSGGGRRSNRKVVLSSVGAVVVLGLVLVLILNQTGFGHKNATAAPAPSGFQPTATAPADAAKETAAAFLSAWQSGNLQQAAGLTDDPSQALSTLGAYRKNLNLAGLQLTAQSSTATTQTPDTSGSSSATAAATASGPAGSVTFAVQATVGLPSSTMGTGAGTSASASASAGSSSGTPASSASSSSASSTTASGSAAPPTATWSYSSQLTAYEKNGGWWVKWTPGLVAPNLTATTKVVSVPIPAQADEVTDSSGNSLSGAADAGLRNIAAALKKNAPTGQGTPGIEVELQNADGTPIAGTADKLSQPVNTGVLKTTIDAQVERAAMNAVSLYPQSSMVVLRPSTGEILAVANNAGGNDFALTARIAPGSTNKIITSTALMVSGLVSSPAQAVECPKTVTIDGQSFGNSQNESLAAGTPFLEDFAQSCNNAFTQWYNQIGSTTLAQTAQKYYGLNQQWDIGLGPAGPYYNIPSSAANGELAMELFGQGQLEAAPLAMASVAATVDTGSFKQPIVVPGTPQLSATPLPSGVQQNLWKMMHAVTQSGGTAAGVYSGVADEVYAKTGTADKDSVTPQKSNSWMVVFDPKKDIAIGCVVLNAGYGALYAGPETASVLKALQ